MAKRILFFDLPNPAFRPAITELGLRKYRIVLNDPAGCIYLREKGIVSQFWADFATPIVCKRIEEGSTSVLNRIQAALQDSRRDEAFVLPDEGSFLLQYGSEFIGKLAQLVCSEIEVIETLNAITAHENLDLVVLGGDNSHRQRVLIEWAKREGIVTLNLSHATFAQTIQARYAANQTNLYADYVAAYGERSKTDMIALGYPREKIHVIGAPIWDSLLKTDLDETPAQARARMGLDAEQKTVLFCGCYAEAANAFFGQLTNRAVAMHKALATTAKELPWNIQFVFRPHPIEVGRSRMSEEERTSQIASYENWLKSLGFRNPRISTGAIEDDVKSAEAVVSTNGSSVIPLAMMLDRPILAYRWYRDESITYDEQDGVLLAHSDEDLTPALARILENPRYSEGALALAKAALPGINRGHDGQAIERLVRLVEKLALERQVLPNQVSSPENVSSPSI